MAANSGVAVYFIRLTDAVNSDYNALNSYNKVGIKTVAIKNISVLHLIHVIIQGIPTAALSAGLVFYCGAFASGLQ